MVKADVAKYGGTASDINADVAEAYSVGQVARAGRRAPQEPRQHEDHRLPAQRRDPADRAGPGEVRRARQEPVATAFIFQWQNGKFVQVLPAGATGSVTITQPEAGLE